MLKRIAITKLQSILFIDLIIVAFAAGGYYYIQTLPESAAAPSPPPPKPAEFQVTNLTLNRLEAGVGQPIVISVNVTNVGETVGSYTVNLTINDAIKEKKTIQLLGGESKTVEFIDTESKEGSYSVKIDGLTGTFKITTAPTTPTVPSTPSTPSTPKPHGISMYNLIISPDEAWVGDSIQISATVINYDDVAGNYSISLTINGAVRENKTLQLSGGATSTIGFTVTEENVGTYNVQLGTLTGTFEIVPNGYHTLSIYSSPYSTVPFTLNNVTNSTPYSALLNAGMYTIVMPPMDPTSVDQFLRWEDGSTNPTRTIILTSRTSLTAYYTGGRVRSCPSLYIWNGTNYVYVAEVSSGTGYLGILDYFREDGSMVFAYSYPWDYIKLDRSQLQPRNGYYDMTLTQISDEIFYLDAARLIVVDHSPDVDVYSTKGTYIYNLENQGKIYTVSKNPLTPIFAINGEGENVLPQISKLDGIYTTAHEFQYDTLTLNLGNLSEAKEIKLIVAGTTIYSSGEDQGAWAAKFFNQPGVKPFPPPYMEVKDENGSWVRVPESRQFPLLTVLPTRFVVNLTGLFPTNDYSLRINNFFNAPFDYIGVDTTPQQNVTIHTINPSYAHLHQVETTNSTSTGNFTRYGYVTSLMLEADDKFVIGRQGDEVSLKYPAMGPVPEGMERDFFVFASVWFKVPGLPYLGFTVDPLPFHDMSVFPYPPTESYPYDGEHLNYLLEYNTRTIAIP